MEYLRPGIFFEERKTPKAYITAFTTLLEGINRRGILLLFSCTEVIISNDVPPQT